MITSDSVERACSEVGEYSDEKMMGEFDRFFRSQPAICDFIVELTHESGPQIQELALFLSYMVFKATELGQSNAVGAVTPAAIEDAYRESESWIDRMSQTDAAALQAAINENLKADQEPYLIQYVISELNEPLEDGTELSDEDKGEVFFVLRTVISSFNREEKGKIIDVN